MTQAIEFFFDVGSPYSYLASTQVDRVGAECGAPVTWIPFLLGGVFKSVGHNPSSMVPAKARYQFRDLHQWATRYGVEFSWPSRFPLNTLKAQRALTGVGVEAEQAGGNGSLAVSKLASALFAAYWVEDRDISDLTVLGEVIAAAGFDPTAVAAAASAQAVKDRLRSVTDDAVARGAFGAPTFFVGEEMYFGNDRLVLVADAVSGVRS